MQPAVVGRRCASCSLAMPHRAQTTSTPRPLGTRSSAPVLMMPRQCSTPSLTVQCKLRAMQTAFRFCVSCKQQHALLRHPLLRALLAPSRGQRLRAASVACAAVGGGGGSGIPSDGGDGGSGGQPGGEADEQRHLTGSQLGEEVLLLDVSGTVWHRLVVKPTPRCVIQA